jgi:hypothetical protein
VVKIGIETRPMPGFNVANLRIGVQAADAPGSGRYGPEQ